MKIVKWLGIIVGILILAFGLAVILTPPLEYETRVEVDRPVDVSWRVFADESRMGEWLPGFESIETISGEPRTPGSRFRLTFVEDGREIVFEEEVLVWKDEKEYAFRMEHPAMRGEHRVIFEDLGGGRTAIVNESEVKFHELMRPLTPLMKGGMIDRTRESYAKLKQMIEAEPVVVADPSGDGTPSGE